MTPYQQRIKPDYNIIHEFVKPNSSVLDMGCGDGSLLESLIKEKNAKGLGLELSSEGINQCLKKGLPVLQVNIDKGLADFTDKSFDYVILNMTLQVVYNPLFVIREMIRVGKKAIVGFPNFGHYRLRLGLALTGRMPKSKTLPYEWYDTPNIRLMTVKDFKTMCKKNNINILKEIYLSDSGKNIPANLANLFASEGVFLLEELK
ncbi:MAG: methionine biosynthesis protein MetW [Candidatus Margulisbacteria bacterium]|nr:methionine biosynthesis protein MetW [Candidatus Margulisiibacteriota bacterium]MBU1022509.1 methionine biosynthesis protein MetW [Candidatus Margulisiibacteriota bacterium]MBU1728493.1 methionine biosynthesis protein MetW [Candidatus Margulisiibacteriota bacterium]MBU1954640.1 methionine biosynthesis protein MetW [Candidatus Margulisiibacteriota bacterium]